MLCAQANISEKTAKCKCICLLSDDTISAQIIELIKEDPKVKVSHIEQPTIGSNPTVLLMHSPTNGVLVLSFLATVARVTFQSFPNGTTTEPTAACQCQDILSIIRNIFILKKFHTANICKERSSTGDQSNAISPELLDQVDSRMTELFCLKDAMASLFTRNESPSTGISMISEILTKELIAVRLGYHEKLQELHNLVQNKLSVHGGESSTARGNIGPMSDSSMELQMPQQGRSSGVFARSQTTQNPGIRRDIPLHQPIDYPLAKLLQFFSVNLLPKQWAGLRLEISRYIPMRELDNLPNGVAVFNELLHRKLITHQNLDLLHKIFLEVQRFDYVHLIDSVKEGDYTLLDQYYQEQELPNDTGASNSQSAATVQEIRRSTVEEHRAEEHRAEEHRAEDAVSFQVKLDIKGGSLADQVSRDPQPPPTTSRSPTPADHELKQDAPPEPQVPLTVPMQEVSRVEVDGDVRVNSPVTQAQRQTRNHEGIGSRYAKGSTAGNSHAGSNHPGSNHARSNHTGSYHPKSNHTGSDCAGNNQGGSIQSGSVHSGSKQGDRSTNQGDNHAEVGHTGSGHAGSGHTGSGHGESNGGGSNPGGSSQAGRNRGEQLARGLSGGNQVETVAKLEFPCEHYDRYCHVQFRCCDKFWPCHRCHNKETTCGNKKLRSVDIKKIKCRRCQKIQEFPKEHPNCEACGLKFAQYFCVPCKHLTGSQSHPYHCLGCGICRINEHRSFHCDVCGVCLDVHLLDNHKCRAGSAHDECCICFEDAFTGCQILPCSHKVHKDCATAMLKNGITKCPICRESFAHLVQRRKPESSSK